MNHMRHVNEVPSDRPPKSFDYLHDPDLIRRLTSSDIVIGSDDAEPTRTRKRKPSVASVIRQMKRAGVEIAGCVINPRDGTVKIITNKANENDDARRERRMERSVSAMMRRPPKFVQGFVDHNGHARFYFRRTGFKRVPLPGLPWSPTFMKAYEAAMADQPPPPMIVAPKPAKQGSLAALAASYLASAAYLSMKPATRRAYNLVIEKLCKSTDKNGTALGTLSAATLRREHVLALMTTRAENPTVANQLRKVLRALMQHAVEIGMRPDDPTRDVKAMRVKSNGFHSWADAEIAQFEARHPVGTKARLALALLLYTGQRRSDVVTMGRQHIDKNDAIHLRTGHSCAALCQEV
jgi:hypothetical protein